MKEGPIHKKIVITSSVAEAEPPRNKTFSNHLRVFVIIPPKEKIIALTKADDVVVEEVEKCSASS